MDDKKIIEKVLLIRRMLVGLIALIILVWAFFKNQLVARIIISPFIICSITYILENLFLVLDKQKVAKIFQYIFRITLLIYTFGILIYTCYYSIAHKEYSLLIVVVIFLFFLRPFLKGFKVTNKKHK